ncbi:MAG: Holliday junction DNA helicase RuvA [Rhizobiales bacterium 65-9]|nr:Holliday junction resolvase RuvX [Hyphomicrobiales bacterium]OJY34047.1 MAG: Holliday junction DNA helicase RuvA [Rhizobiales bacterium 65-9]
MPSPVLDRLDAFARLLPAQGALIGLDLGTKTIGVAVSDVTRFIATPLETVRRIKFTRDCERLQAIMAERAVAGVVLGLPLNMDDSEGPRAQSTRAFGREFSKRIAVPIVFWDERLSTEWAHDHLAAQNYDAAARAKIIDRVAASHILQGVLDGLRSVQRPEP